MNRLIQPRNLPIDVQEKVKNAIRSLPIVHKEDVDKTELCAICLTPFSSIFEEEETAKSITTTETLEAAEEGLEESSYGLTKVEVCGHIFCRRDLTEWISGLHGSCPTCRRPFLNIHLPSESDDESSDGGEYIPTDDLEEEDDAFDFTDSFSEFDNLDVDISLDDYLQQTAQGSEPTEHHDVDSVALSETESWATRPDMEVSSEGDVTETENDPVQYTISADSDDEMDEDYVPMDEDEEYSDTDSEPSFSLTDRESDGMSSEVDDLSLEEIYPGAYAVMEDRVSVHGMEDDIGLPDHEKGLNDCSSNGDPSEGLSSEENK